MSQHVADVNLVSIIMHRGNQSNFAAADRDGSRVPAPRVAELVFWAIVGGLRSQKYEGGKSASGARQSRCDVGAV